MSEHVWAQESIAAYVAGGLDPAEGERLEKHMAECPACARFVDEARSLERTLAPLFVAANPGPALEDRVIHALPPLGHRRRLVRLPAKFKAMLAVAACLLLAALGAGVSELMDQRSLRFPAGSNGVQASNDLRQVGLAMEAGGALKPLHAPLENFEVDVVGGSGAKEASGKQGKPELPSADDLAKDLRDVTLNQLKDEGRKGEQSKNLDMLYQSENKPAPVMQPPVAPATPPPGAAEGGRGPSQFGPGGAGFGMPATTNPVPATGLGTGLAPPGLASAGTLTPNLPSGWGLSPGKDDKGGEGDKRREVYWKYRNNGDLPPLAQGYFKPGDSFEAGDKNKEKGEKDLEKLEKLKGDLKSPKESPPIPGPSSAKTPEEGAQKTDPAQPPPQQQPAPRKIIIRTGELEFEIESFDASVATIMKLVTAAKGSFVATINSDKLTNGKVRGSVVVRVPPELLDTFLLDLRKELGKTGELKNQRIGSLDISKQYTDIESRLRAARSMEERLLAIIKDGKGQIKDLLAAEKELGVWRTQIESLEGELRYYANQASLATLTIKLYEKDIRIAASVTESERVQAGIEVEDVEKAHQEALKAILDAKGRVTRSELKQHTAGQFNAVLHFEVAPEAAGPMRDRLRQLGTMVRLQVDRLQQTEDGGPAPKDGKIQRGPTQFLVSIYNLANVAPRETVILRLAAADVPAVYQKLRLAVAKAKGHVINAQLDEKDRHNINAQVDFHVSRLGESEVLAALPAAGETLSRQVSRVPESDNVTDSKVLYRIALIDADSIQPRETVVVRIAAADVPAAYQKLRDAVGKAKARVFTAQLNEQDRRNINAQLDFTLRRTDEPALQAALVGAGETLSRQVTRMPESPNLTDSKVLFQVALLDADAVPARETVTVKIAATDVAVAYQKLREAVDQAKGRVLAAQINEQDRRNVTAQLEFTLRRSDDKVLETALAAAGETLSRLVTRAAENANATDTKVHAKVDLMPAAAIPPRETTTLAMEVTDVAQTLTLFSAQVKEVQGRTVETQVGQERNGQVSARVVFDVPLSEAASLVEKFKTAGQARVHQVSRDPQAPEGKLALGRLVVTLSNTPLLVPSDQDLWSQIRRGLAFSLRGLSISASYLIVGLLFVLPWVLVLYALFWLARRAWRAEAVPATATGAPAGNVPSAPAG